MSPDRSFLSTSRRGSNSSPEALPHPLLSSPLPGAAPPVSPAPTRKPPESTFQDGTAGNRHPDLPEPRNLWTLDGLGEGAQKERREERDSAAKLPPLYAPKDARCSGQTSRPRKQGWRWGGTQHPLNCKAKQCAWAAEAPEASRTPTSNRARSWVPPTLRAEVCPPPAPTHALSQSLLPQATPYRSRRGPGHLAARRPHRAGLRWQPPLILETRSPGTLPSREMQDGLQRDREPLIGRRPP